MLCLLLLAGSARAQRTQLDWKMHDAGQVRQLVTNMGALWASGTNYPGLIYCEYPPNSLEEHIGEGGIWIGGIVEGDTLVSVSSGWNSAAEFYAGPEPSDTVWVVTDGDTLDIPWWGAYTGVSDQDFVTKYSDYRITDQGTHRPMYLDVVQKSFAWASPPYDEVIVFTYHIIPTQKRIEQAYIALWVDGNVGYRGGDWEFALDDYSEFYRERYLGVSRDASGGRDGLAISPIGFRVYPPEGVDPETLNWTFNWYPGQGLGAPPEEDALRYDQMAAGEIMENQARALGSQYIISFGPFDLSVGDTLTFKVGQSLGEGFEGMMENVEHLDWLVANDFQVPSPPPPPPTAVTPEAGQVTLNWKAEPGQVDPEQYQDPNRADSSAQPFEGYRVYKSTWSKTGPWTLLAEFDVPGNAYGSNTGLQYELTDTGLLNNFEYYYTVTSFSKPDRVTNFPSLESSRDAVALRVVPGTAPPETVGQVAVVPNPYRGDAGYQSYNPRWERPPDTRARWMEQDRRVQFINLPARCEIRVYTISGDLVQTIQHESASQGYEDWNLTSSVGQAISSGIYLFTVEDLDIGATQTGKFVVIK